MYGQLVLCLPGLEKKREGAPIAVEGSRRQDVVLPQSVALDLELVPKLLLAWGTIEGSLRDVVGVVIDVPDVLVVELLVVSHDCSRRQV